MGLGVWGLARIVSKPPPVPKVEYVSPVLLKAAAAVSTNNPPLHYWLKWDWKDQGYPVNHYPYFESSTGRLIEFDIETKNNAKDPWQFLARTYKTNMWIISVNRTNALFRVGVHRK